MNNESSAPPHPHFIMLDLIKREKSKNEKTRTIAKIHLSWNTARKVQLEMVEKYSKDYDPVSSNAHNTLLGCELLIHMDQGEEFWFEDINGQKIITTSSYFPYQ